MEKSSLSRRDLLTRLSTTAAAAAIGAGLLSQAGVAAPTPADDAKPAPPDAGAGMGIYNVRFFGAKGDGKTLDTAAIQAAIDACTKDKGGTVYVPTGQYLIGTIEIKNNVTLHVSQSARLVGSPDIAHYHGIEATPGSAYGAVLILARDAENIAIEGNGTIDGQGALYLHGAHDDGERDPGRPRPHLAIFLRVKHLTLRDIFFTNSAYHCCRVLNSSYVLADNVRIHTRVHFNNDGFHINTCQHVKIINCDITCEDDACALFGSNRDVTVTNCTFSTRWSIFRFGGGVSENITVSNCVINDTFGCPIKAQVSARTRMENMIFSNIVMNNVTGPIYIGLGSVPRNSMSTAETTKGGIVRNIIFQGIRATTAPVPDLKEFPYLPGTPISDIYKGEHHTCINLTSVPGQVIENVSLSDIHVTFAGGGTAAEGALRDVPQVSGAEYFGLGVLPAYGLYARNVRGLRMNNVRFDLAAPDLRPAMVLDGVEDAMITGFSAQGDPKAEALMRMTNTRDAMLTVCKALTPAAAFLQLEGTENEAITIQSSNLTKAAKPLLLERGAMKKAVKIT